MIEKKQGETFYLDIEVLNKDRSPTDLTNATTGFSYESPKGEVTTKACTISQNIVTATLTPLETSTMLGIYNLEVKVKDLNSDIDEVFEEKLMVKRSLNPTFGIEE